MPSSALGSTSSDLERDHRLDELCKVRCMPLSDLNLADRTTSFCIPLGFRGGARYWISLTLSPVLWWLRPRAAMEAAIVLMQRSVALVI